MKLHGMLENVAASGDESIVSWQANGMAFRVHQPEVFARTVMPHYFKQQTKYKSFQRQLHIYNFHRIRTGVDTGAYFHSMFIRNKKLMTLRMSCQKIKGKKKKPTTGKENNALDHHATGDPGFCSSETHVDNNLTNALQSDTILQACTTATKEEKKKGCSKHGPTRTDFIAGSTPSDRHTDTFLNSALFFNQEAVGAGPSPSHQLTDTMEQGQTTISKKDDEQAVCSGVASEKSNEQVLALLRGVDHQKNGDEGFFAGKRFFYVETKTPLI
jgi:hypothetical protein